MKNLNHYNSVDFDLIAFISFFISLLIVGAGFIAWTVDDAAYSRAKTRLKRSGENLELIKKGYEVGERVSQDKLCKNLAGSNARAIDFNCFVKNDSGNLVKVIVVK